ncbi:MAG: aminopeptidase [archaeon]|nr:MAG: aminopeptidase [archaeon]
MRKKVRKESDLTGDPRLLKLADLALTYSLRLPDIRRGRRRRMSDVLIAGEAVTAPLMLAAQEAILKRGHTVQLRPRLLGAQRNFYEHADARQLDHVSTSLISAFNNTDYIFAIRGSEDPLELKDADSYKMSRVAKTRKFLGDMRKDDPWILVPFPTKGAAKLARMSFNDYVNFLFKATLVGYKQMEEDQKPLADAFNNGREVILRTRGPEGQLYELKMGISHSYAINHPGRYNIPDGEVFTAPDIKGKRLTEGEVFVQDYPAIIRGKRVSGIYLRFERGKIVDFDAKEGREHLESIIKTDDGTRQLGEIAVATNNQIARYPFTEDILFDEKRGRTAHFAIGAAFDDSFTPYDPQSKRGIAGIERARKNGWINESAQHVDVITGLLSGDKKLGVYIDGRKVVKKGRIYTVEAA